MQEPGDAPPTPLPQEAGLGLGVKAAIIVLGIVIVGGVAFLGAVLSGMAGNGKPARQAIPGPYAHLDGTSAGDPAAKVQVYAIVPLRTDCHSPSIAYLLAASKAYPDKISVRFVDRRLPHGEEELKRLHLDCASILCNGTTTHTLPGGKKVKLEGGPNERFSIEDLRTVLQGLADQTYGQGAVALPDAEVAEDRPAPPLRP